MVRSKLVLGRFSLLLCLSGVLAGCASGPAYAPQGSSRAIGYSDEQLSSGRYRVTFAGNVDNSREQVQNYLLRRAAEVTLAAGYTHFVVDKLNTETRVSPRTVWETSEHPLGWGTQVNPPPTQRPWTRSNWQANFILPRVVGDSRRYVATSEILMLSGEDLARNPNAISAAEVLERSGRPGA